MAFPSLIGLEGSDQLLGCGAPYLENWSQLGCSHPSSQPPLHRSRGGAGQSGQFCCHTCSCPVASPQASPPALGVSVPLSAKRRVWPRSKSSRHGAQAGSMPAPRAQTWCPGRLLGQTLLCQAAPSHNGWLVAWRLNFAAALGLAEVPG